MECLTLKMKRTRFSETSGTTQWAAQSHSKRLKLYTKRHRVKFHKAFELSHTGQLQSMCQSISLAEMETKRDDENAQGFSWIMRESGRMYRLQQLCCVQKRLVTIWRHNTSSQLGRQVNSTNAVFNTGISRWQSDKSHRFNQLTPCFAVATAYSNDREPDGKLMPLRQQPISIASLGLTRWKQQRSASLYDVTAKGRKSLCFAHRYPNSNTVPYCTMALSNTQLVKLFAVKDAKYLTIDGCACQTGEYGIKVTQWGKSTNIRY